jgi:hypothetical protein
MNAEYVWKRPHQKQYVEETGIEGVVILDEQIEFRFGYTSIVQRDVEGRNVHFLIPTMTDSMLTKEIVKSRFFPESQDNAILYETESEPWIDVLGTKLPDKEYELACEVLPYLVRTPIEILKASARRPYNQKLFEQQMAQINSQK